MPLRQHLWKKLFLIGFFALHSSGASGGVIVDGSMGGGSGALSGPNYDILSSYGKIVGPNLFHSFQTFNVGSGEMATFSGPASVSNILARVTGGSASSIDGVLRSTISGANLYLLNPSGILFGQNASLDISGSFSAATADYLRLGASGRFDVTDPAADLLTVDPPTAFGFLGVTPAAIDLQNAHLEVLPEKSLNFVAGEITLFGDGTATNLSAPGGAVNLVAGGGGEVASTSTGMTSALTTAGAITIAGDWTGDSAQIDVGQTTGAGGRVYISGGRFLLENASITSSSNSALPGGEIAVKAVEVTFDGGVVTTSTAADGAGGDIRIEGETIHIGGSSRIASEAADGASGGAGDILLRSGGSVSIDDYAWISNDTYGDGAAGAIVIDATSVHIGGYSTVSSNSADDSTDYFANGDAGDITIRAAGEVLIDGYGWAMSEAFDEGDAGNLTIQAGTFTLLGSGYLSSYTNYNGDAGNILIEADAIRIGGDSYVKSSALTDTWGVVTGNAGDITLVGHDQIVINGRASVTSDTEGIGSAGDVNFASSGRVIIGNRAYLSTSTTADGAAGNVLIEAKMIHLGGDSHVTSSSGSGSGSAGDIALQGTSRVVIDGGAWLESSTSGSGNAGDIAIGSSGEVAIVEEAYISTSTTDDGAAGNVSIAADSIHLGGDSYLTSSTGSWWGGGSGEAGDISLQGGSQVQIDGSAWLESSTSGSGNAGDITIGSSGEVIIRNEAYISTSSSSDGAAGNVSIAADSILVGGDSYISSSSGSWWDSGSGSSGDITLQADGRVLIHGDAFIDSESTGTGDAGNISIAADSILIGGNSYVSSSAGSWWDDTASGNAGNITLLAENQVNVFRTAWVESETYGNGDAGDILIDAETIQLSGDSWISNSAWSDTASGSAGDITLLADGQVNIGDTAWVQSEAYGSGAAGDILIQSGTINIAGNSALPEGAYVSTTTYGTGDAGNITLNGVDQIAITGMVQVMSETKGAGAAGTIVIQGNALQVVDGATISTNTLSSGDAGSITLEMDGAIRIDGGVVSGNTAGTGGGGSVSVTSGSLAVSNGGRLSATSSGDGSGVAGNIDLNIAGDLLMTSGGAIETSTEDADGGDISASFGTLLWMQASSITTSVQGGSGNGGNITLLGGAIVLDNSNISANAYGGDGGNINITANPLLVDRDGSITASSQLGVQGTIGISMPLVDLGGSLADLPDGILADDMTPQTCSTVGSNVSSFVVRDILPSRRRSLDASPF